MVELQPRHHGVRRRALVAGAAWSVPVIGATTIAPAIAASRMGSFSAVGTGQTKESKTFSVPCGQAVTYTVIGGGGGGYQGNGGSAERITGSFTIAPGCLSCTSGHATVTIVAAGGGSGGIENFGAAAANFHAAPGGQGHGNGGKGGDMVQATPADISTQQPNASIQCGGGGGGSAILVGSTPVIVAGGGGGGGADLELETKGSAAAFWFPNMSYAIGDGGSAPGGTGQTERATITQLTPNQVLTQPGGAGGTTSAPGAGAAGGTSTYTPNGPGAPTATVSGNSGTGPSTGNGGDGVTISANFTAGDTLSAMFGQCGSAGGGGGYTGGASSGAILSSYRNSATPRHLLVTGSGGGGAGASYVAPTDTCFTMGAPTRTSAANGGSGGSWSAGGVGSVSVSWG